ncbi:hypothetical protein [Streptomyces sp. bgisy091]|uniref:hypothetical protein n=1 Tax=Streptomyces sp. bgisy091 TaxID=3413778 RepID=UPI003D7096D1
MTVPRADRRCGRVDFLREAVSNPLSPLLVAGELSLLGEFPEASHARAVGSGERTFSTITAQAGVGGALRSGWKPGKTSPRARGTLTRSAEYFSVHSP